MRSAQIMNAKPIRLTIALEVTATRCAFTFVVIKTFHSHSKLGPGSRISAFSR
jgi:hypothetical protein